MTFEFNPLTVLGVIFAALCSTSLCELVSWLLVYRKEDYKLLKGTKTLRCRINIKAQQEDREEAQHACHPGSE